MFPVNLGRFFKIVLQMSIDLLFLRAYFFSVADPDSGSGAFLTSGSGIRNGEKTGPESGMNNPNHIFESLETNFLG
jgi:hypothetical protein